jgi:hypothetical protein
VGRSVFLNNRNRDLLVICGHWTSRFACSLWALGRSVFVNNRNWDLLGVCGHWAPRFSFWFYRFLNNKNRTEPKPVGLNRFRFGFKILKLIMSVWFIFLCKNRTEPKMISPKFNVELLKLLERLSMEYWNKIPHIELGHKIYAQPLINSVLFRIFKISK